jgi:hypothetical protein
MAYILYVDDILIMYNNETTDINATLLRGNQLHQNVLFTFEPEFNSKLIFLDLILQRKQYFISPSI